MLLLDFGSDDACYADLEGFLLKDRDLGLNDLVLTQALQSVGGGPRLHGTAIDSENPQFHTLIAQLLFSYKFNSSWSMVLQVAPSLAGDFANVDGDHFRLAGTGLVSYRFSPRIELGAGIAATYRFGSLLPVPVLRVDWRISESVHFDAVFGAHRVRRSSHGLLENLAAFV